MPESLYVGSHQYVSKGYFENYDRVFGWTCECGQRNKRTDIECIKCKERRYGK